MTENRAASPPSQARRQASAAPVGPVPGRAHRAARRRLVPLAIAAVVTAAGALGASPAS